MTQEFCGCEYIEKFAKSKKDWKRLLKNRCPTCNKELWFDENERMIMCHNLRCGFMVDQDKMNKICLSIQEGYLSKQDYSDIY